MKYYQQLNTILRSAGLKSAGVYVFSNFFAKATAFFLLFIYSNPYYISIEENGLLNLLGNAVYILMPFLSLGILQSTSVDFFKLKTDEFKDFFTTSFIIPLIVMVLSIMGMLALNNQLKSYYGFPLSFCYIIPAMAFLAFCNEQYVGLIRNNNKPLVYLKATFLRLFIEVGLSVVLVVIFAWRWKGRVTGIMTASTVLLLASFFYFRKNGYLFGKVRTKYLKSELSFALPVILMQCGTFCLIASDKFFLSYFTDNREVGIYSYACVFASVITLFSSAIISYVRPMIYQNLSKTIVDTQLIKKHLLYYIAINSAALIGIIAFTPLMYKFFINKSYHPGLQYMYLLALGYFFSNVTVFFYSFMLYHKQKKYIMILSLSAILISLGFNYVFIKQMGAAGGALSVCVSYGLMLILTLLISHKNFSFIFMNKPPLNNK
ncbi:MAG: polysaccharide biosynthesis C-terminal domain-containing protein [Rhizobacter sp.]|nr:polysaccharide biosynthesis C-terminal domain-containing protein [Ferruginibacter sp.]